MYHLTVNQSSYKISKIKKRNSFILAHNKWGLATTVLLYVSSAVAVPFFAMRWQLLKKRAG
jgi:hypothetical protein